MREDPEVPGLTHLLGDSESPVGRTEGTDMI